ncbi:hypothetical protein BOTNAR_0107g00110 [Botryotinia narcissicola]|uniref:Uncharacterized protein n=1 Tax=Botryotinia narcissicola TaxID=278944 RepID=A0A4Z1J230_9HELO|nr:hypothetical protein BOTNAR_0107g00110 [Botryotinia narcissicola]
MPMEALLLSYTLPHLGNVHVINFLLRKSAIKDLQENKAHGLGTVVLNTKPQDGDIVHETEIYKIDGSSDKEDEEPDFEIVSDIDDDDDDDATGSGHFDSGGYVDVDFTVTDHSND